MKSYFKPLFQELGISDWNDHPKLKEQVKLFNDALASFVDSLDDVANLTVLVHKVANKHSARGVQLKDYQVCID